MPAATAALRRGAAAATIGPHADPAPVRPVPPAMPSSSHAFAAAHALPLNPVARRLAYAGLAPFVLGALLALLVREEAHPYVMMALTGYGAVIVSFLGGIHWGLGMRGGVPSPSPFAWAVVPSLVAWIAVQMPADAGLVIDAVMLVVCYLVDRRVYPGHGLSHWLTLRFRLTLVAALCCLVGAASTL
jgi:hypothetical protein